jgi:starch phosphorylase
MDAPGTRPATDPVIRTRPAPDLEIPEMFGRLRDIAFNLWWTWSPQAHRLFHQLAPATWRHYRNPVDVLIDLGAGRWRSLSEDDDFSRSYHALVAQFDAYLRPAEPTWFERRHGDYRGGPFAYFCTEFGWHECLQIYSGGLGILAGDHCKSASDLGLPFVGVGLMYSHGYFRQSIDAEGFQQHSYPDYDLHRMPLLQVVDETGREIHVAVELPGRQVHARVWRALVGRVSVLLLDTDLPINHPADRAITSALYVRGREMRLCQEIVLGFGGTQALEALGIRPASWHINEGHSALLLLQRARRALEREARPLPEILAEVAGNTLFTTHTPVPAGNEIFDVPLVEKVLAEWSARVGIPLPDLLALGQTDDAPASFNLTALALRTSRWANGVSEMHATVANRMWQPLLDRAAKPPIEHVTNGVHTASWVGPQVGDLLRRHAGPAFESGEPDESFAARVRAIPDHELWTAHLQQKRSLINLLRARMLEQFARHGRSPDELREVDGLLDVDVLTIGFARRFATYKRADLVLRDEKRLRALVQSADRPIQLIFAGKAHPADRPGQDLIRRIWQASLTPELRGRALFVENHDMRMARSLVQGVDLWLNTPRRPNEASGTSGMKAAVNGVLNCSILDGWWCEGQDDSHGWSIVGAGAPADEAAQDEADADALYRVLVDGVLPSYYGRNEHGLPADWIRRMKQSIALLTPRFGTARMVREYVERYYLTAVRDRSSG